MSFALRAVTPVVFWGCVEVSEVIPHGGSFWRLIKSCIVDEIPVSALNELPVNLWQPLVLM